MLSPKMMLMLETFKKRSKILFVEKCVFIDYLLKCLKNSYLCVEKCVVNALLDLVKLRYNESYFDKAAIAICRAPALSL